MTSAATMPTELDLNFQDYFGIAFSNTDTYLKSTSPTESIFERIFSNSESPSELQLPSSEHARKRANLRRMASGGQQGSSNESFSIGHNLLGRHEEFFERKIKSFLSLTENWDGDGARAIPMPAIYSSLNYMEEIANFHLDMLAFGISPSPDGEVVVYWHSKDAYAELNFDENGECTFCFGVGEKQIEVLEEHPNEDSRVFERDTFKAVVSFLESHFIK